MKTIDKKRILTTFKKWFKDSIAINAVKNTKKLDSVKSFDINPFLRHFNSNYLFGNSNPESIAKSLVLFRLPYSINTSFGTNLQKFITDELSNVIGGSASGVDIEFIDQIDGDKKYCQLKAGPNTINSDDVEPIAKKFQYIINKSKIDNLKLGFHNMVVGTFFGEREELSKHYINIEEKHNISVYPGSEFWLRLTGDNNFYKDLIDVASKIGREVDGVNVISETVELLSKDKNIV